MKRILSMLVVLSLFGFATGAGAATYTYSGTQNAMVPTQCPTNTYDTVDFNITAGYFTASASTITYDNPNIIFTSVVQNNGNANSVTIFSGLTTVTGAGAFSLTTQAGSSQDWVFAGNMTGYSGNVSVVLPNVALSSGTTLGNNSFSIVQYGGTTSGGTVAKGTVTGSSPDRYINNVAGTGTLSVNNLVFNYGTDSSYDYLKVTNSSIATRYGLHNIGNANIWITGVVSGAGSMNKSGTGTLTLTGVNTYTGATTVSAGTLTISGSGQLNSGAYAGAISNSGALIYSSSAAQTLSGVISGTGTLTKNTGTGTLIISGDSTYSGVTTINAGTLQIGAGGTTGTIGSASIVVGSGANLTINRSTALAYAGAVSGAGSVTKSGAGELTVAGTNLYTGATSINAGTLNVTGSLAAGSAVSLASGAVLKGSGTVGGSVTVATGTGAITGGDGTTGTLTAGNLTFSGTGVVNIGTLTNYTAAPSVNVTGTLALNGGPGAVTINLPTAAVSAGTYHLIGTTSLGNLTGFSATGTRPTLSSRQSGALALNTGYVDYVVTGVNPYWTGAVSSEWSLATMAEPKNWATAPGATTDYLAGDIVLFNDNAVGTTVNIAADVSPGAVEFNNSTLNYTVTGAAGIAGATGLVKNGTGTVTLNNVNTYAGTTTINAGTLEVGGGAAIADAGAVVLANTAGATLRLAAHETIGSLAGGGTTGGRVNLQANTLTVGGTASTTFAGVIEGTGALAKSGSGTLALSGQSTHTGGTTINGGVLDLTGGGGASGTIRGTVTVNAGGTLRLSTGDALGYNADATVVNTIHLVGGTMTTAAGPNQTTTADIHLTGGTINGTVNLDLFSPTPADNNASITTHASATQSTISVSTLNLRQDSVTFDVEDGAAAADLLVSSTIGNGTSGTHNMVKTGAGLMTLSGQNTFSGNVTVNQGKLVFGVGGQAANPNTWGPLGPANTAVTKLVIASGATVDVNGYSNTGYGVTIAGSGVGGAGALINNGANTSDGNIQTPNIALSANATIGGTGNFYMIAAGYGANTLTLNNNTLTKVGSNTFYLCNTTVSSGTVQISGGALSQRQPSNGSAAAFILDDTAGATLALNGYNLSVGSLAGGGATGGNVSLGSGTLTEGALNTHTAYAGVASGSGGLTKTGSGTLTLSGANTYTGATTVSGGTLAVTGGLYRGAYNPAVVTINSGATLALTDWAYNTTTAALGGLSANATSLVINGGTIRITGTTPTSYGRGVTVNAGGATLEAGTGANWTIDTVTDSSAWVYNGDPSLTLKGAGTGEFQKVFSGAGVLNKSGTGIWTLTGANTYTGVTTISDGTLKAGVTQAFGATGAVSLYGGTLDMNHLAVTAVVDYYIGTLLNMENHNQTTTVKSGATLDTTLNPIGTGSLIVENGGTLMGEQAIAGAATIQGLHAPGNSPGVQEFKAGLVYDSTATLQWEFNGDTLSIAGTDYDQITVSGGDLTIAGGALLRVTNWGGIDYTNAAWDTTRTFTVINFTSGGTSTGDFALDAVEGNTVIAGQGQWSVGHGTNGLEKSIMLTWTQIPEPATFTLIGTALLIATIRRRKVE